MKRTLRSVWIETRSGHSSMGYCTGNDVPDGLTARRGYAGRLFARKSFGGRPHKGQRAGGRRTAGSGGLRRRNWFCATGVLGWAGIGPDETESLEARAERLRGELDAIDQRLQERDQQE